MAISFTDQTTPCQLQEGQVHARQLRGGLRIRVTRGLVWLTISGCRDDIWLTPARSFEYHGRALATFEAVYGAAEFTVSPLRPRRGWRSWFSGADASEQGADRHAQASLVPCGNHPKNNETMRISKLLPHGLIRWF
ncbi:DUF2917 domain-containing protein [Herbaspirillum sp. B65]|uniref:DUF2917 domain-containing protein n=1 Tax=Herbaspirillum sp. B65 TaxID=137708 RepID=UPI00034BE8B0|nr:DUF2917 domain-containing protein [Herbaspirillum sp. B65]